MKSEQDWYDIGLQNKFWWWFNMNGLLNKETKRVENEIIKKEKDNNNSARLSYSDYQEVRVMLKELRREAREHAIKIKKLIDFVDYKTRIGI